MAFRVGQKVVCVDDAPPRFCDKLHMPNWLTKGAQYTIRKSCPEFGVHLFEVVNPIADFFEKRGEGHWDPARFRPLIEKKTETGMAILQEILDRESIEDRKPARVR